MTEPRFLCNNSSKSIMDTLKGESDLKRMCQPEESCRNQVGSHYCCSYGFRSLSSKRSTNVTKGPNMEITSLACLTAFMFSYSSTDVLPLKIRMHGKALGSDQISLHIGTQSGLEPCMAAGLIIRRRNHYATIAHIECRSSVTDNFHRLVVTTAPHMDIRLILHE